MTFRSNRYQRSISIQKLNESSLLAYHRKHISKIDGVEVFLIVKGHQNPRNIGSTQIMPHRKIELVIFAISFTLCSRQNFFNLIRTFHVRVSYVGKD